MAQGSEVGIAATVDRELRAGLYAGVALPAHIRLDVEGAAIGGIDVHDVGRADIHAMSAAVAARHINEGRHGVPYLLSRRSMRRRSIMSGMLEAAARRRRDDERSIAPARSPSSGFLRQRNRPVAARGGGADANGAQGSILHGSNQSALDFPARPAHVQHPLASNT